MPTSGTASNGASFRANIHFRKVNFADGEFRLLEVQRADAVSEPIVCRLVTASHRDDVEYIALSSLFGDIDIKENIIVDGSRVALPENIAAGIRHVRSVFTLQPTAASNPNTETSGSKAATRKQRGEGGPPRWLVHALRGMKSLFAGAPAVSRDRPLRLWVDSLCINYRDAREAKEQLVHMGQVYRNAKVVVGWVGPAENDSDTAIDSIKYVNEVMPPNWGDEEDRKLHPENYSPQHAWYKHIEHFWTEQPPANDAATTRSEETAGSGEEGVAKYHNWAATATLFVRDYFTREWILREIGMAKHPAFLVGTKILSWKHLLRMNRLLEELRDTESDMFPAELRPMVHQFPIGILYQFLSDFDRLRKAERRAQLESSQRSELTQGTGTDSTNYL